MIHSRPETRNIQGYKTDTLKTRTKYNHTRNEYIQDNELKTLRTMDWIHSRPCTGYQIKSKCYGNSQAPGINMELELTKFIETAGLLCLALIAYSRMASNTRLYCQVTNTGPYPVHVYYMDTFETLN